MRQTLSFFFLGGGGGVGGANNKATDHPARISLRIFAQSDQRLYYSLIRKYDI